MFDDQRLIRGSGGGGKDSGSGGRSAVEAQDTLRSVQYAEVLDLICEGEVEGLVDGAKSIYLDDTPLQNADGTYNFSNVSWAFVPGTQTQPALPGFSQPGSETAVGVEIKSSVPVTRTLSADADAVRITLGIPQLSLQDVTNGDLNGTSVTIAIDIQSRDAFGNPGGFVQVKQDTISGKTMSLYPRSYRFPLTGYKPWDIRIRRVTPDSGSSAQVDKVYWSSYTLINETSLTYPNSAVVGVRVSTKQFRSIPQRSYKMRLQKVWVPTNYNPTTRVYTGIWDGNFKYAWTDNPAWIWYDLATNERYGLGQFVPKEFVDHWSLYEIAKYCDQLVSDGYGGVEPRFRCSIYIQTRDEALRVLQQMAGVFRGVAYWGTAAIVPVADMPAQATKLFTPANVINGEFKYAGSARTARHTVALVAWNDPGDAYKQKVEYIPDEEGIARYGVIETEVVAIGSTSRGQAWRVGKHILATELAETEIISFSTGLEGCGLYPGAVFKTVDPARSGERFGGRLLGANLTQVKLDAAVTLEPGRTYTLSLVTPDGTVVDRAVGWGGSSPLDTDILNLPTPLPDVPQHLAMWVLAADNLAPELWRVMGIKESKPTELEITALAYKPEKYAEIDNGVKLESPPTTSVPLTQAPVTNIKVTPSIVTLANGVTNRLIVSWDVPVRGAQYYRVSWRRDSDNPVDLEPADAMFYIDDALPGTYEIRVMAVNSIGRVSTPTTLSYTYTSSAPTTGVSNLALFAPWDTPDVTVVWDPFPAALSYNVEVKTGTTLLSSHKTATPVFTYTLNQNIKDGGPRRAVTIYVRPVTPLGVGTAASSLAVSNPQISAPTGLNIRAGVGSFTLGANRPSARDYAGTIVAVSATSGFTPTPATYRYNGPDTGAVVMELVPGATYFVRAAHYDSMGQDNLVWSSELSVETLNVTGVPSGSSLPADPAAIGGSFAFFLDVADQTVRGLYGWDGTTWKFTRDGGYIVANSVTATQVSGQLLQGLTAKVGELIAGKQTIDASGYFRAGADAYWSSPGFWVGYTGGKYKLSMKGTNGGLRFDGDKVEILDAAGAVMLASHTALAVDWANVGNTPSGIYNSNIIISGGVISGIGTGSGTPVANSLLVPSINNAATTATWSGVSGSGKPEDAATRNTVANTTTDPGTSLGANALWYNPSNSTMLRRNASNTAWENFATYGATFGDASGTGRTVNGQITASNIGIFMAGAAITNAYIGNVIQSTNFVSGTSGWLLNKDGTLELNNILARGSFFSIGGDINIGKVGTYGAMGSMGKWWYDGANGFVFAREPGGAMLIEMQAGANIFRMSSWNDTKLLLKTGSGKTLINFSANENIAEIGGVLRADAIDAVNSINIAGQAVTTSASASAPDSRGLTVAVNVPSGAVVMVSVAADVLLTYGGGIGSGMPGGPNFWLDVLRGDALGNGMASILKSGTAFSSQITGFTILDAPAAGTYTYRFETGLFQGSGGSSAAVRNKRIVAFVAKK